MKLPPASLPQVASFECSCGNMHNSRDGNIPVGWSQRSGEVFCADCTRTGIAARQIKRPLKTGIVQTDKVRLRGEVLELLREGAKLMPKGTPETAAWVSNVNQLIAAQQRAA